jgi:hypothetical protein
MVIVLFLLTLSTPACAEWCLDCILPFVTCTKYHFRENRYEGIRSILISAPTEPKLLSALIGYNSRDIQPPYDNITLAFWLQQSSSVYIEVREDEEMYLMIPAKNREEEAIEGVDGGEGFNGFSWSAKIINYLNISLADLKAIGKIRGRAIVPILLSSSKVPEVIRVEGYNFVFSSEVRTDFDYRIIHRETNNVVFEDSSENEIGEFLVFWDCNDQHGNPVDDGYYRLQIKWTLFPESQPPITCEETYNFYHKAEINTRF